jgi:hypothetical protein
MECTIKHYSTKDSRGLRWYRTTEYLNECIRILVGTSKYWYTSKSEIIISGEINTDYDSGNYWRKATNIIINNTFATRIQNSFTATDNTFVDNINKFIFHTSHCKWTARP